MRWIFASIFGLLVVMGAITVWTEPDQGSSVPVIYWATDPNPARILQVEGFHEWLVREGHVNEDGEPIVELRLDTASQDPTNQKIVIQSIAGVAADLMDCRISQMAGLGVLEDVTEDAQALGFGLDQTYAALAPTLSVGGRQYGFPCVGDVRTFWINGDTLAALGMEPPPREWDVPTFEAYGREFVARANADLFAAGKRQQVFFCHSLLSTNGDHITTSLTRSQGLSVFNETMTACTLDDPRFADVLGLLRKWIYEDRLFPTAAENEAASSSAGYGGSNQGGFITGRTLAIISGRWNLIRLRQLDEPPRVSVSYFPTTVGGFANDVITARPVGLYRGSEHKDLAKLFMAYLASDIYNDQIVNDADALPPDPRATALEEFNRPANFPNEWGSHEAAAYSANHRAIANAESPFVPTATALEIIRDARERVFAQPMLATPEEAAALAARRINREIQLTIVQSQRLSDLHEELTALQRKIDERRAAGQPIPAEWILNPFYREYYAAQGWLEVSGDSNGDLDGDAAAVGEAGP